MLLDNYNRKIEYLRVSVTDRCNLRCIYCMPKDGIRLKLSKEILSFEEIEKIIKIFIKLGVKKVKITGGEPLVRKGIIELLKKLSVLENLKDISLTTNGVFLEEHSEQIKNSGINKINVSLDTLNEDKFNLITGGNCLPKILSGLRKAKETGISLIKINVVILKGINDDEILDFVKFSEENNYIIRFIEYMPLNKAFANFRFISNNEIKEIISKYFGELKPAEVVLGNGPAKYYVTNDNTIIGFISPLSECFCDSCHRIRLTCDGKVKACLFSDCMLDIKEMIRKDMDESNIVKAIKELVMEKPLRYKSEYLNSEKTFMSQIGG
ncbi:MAG: GTP 3',8-cyclase MoaA [Candidatus Firestonebacteria bacterium]